MIFGHDTAEGWARIDAAIGADAPRMRMVKTCLMAFNAAQEAYNAMYANGADQSNVLTAGMAAARYAALVGHMRNDLMGGAPKEEVLAKMQSVSDWLERMGWHGMPRHAFVWMQETPLNRDTAKMHVDMMVYRSSAARVMAAREATARGENAA